MSAIYLDVCCLNRPFDDQSQSKIHLESEAVLLILRAVELGQCRWSTSDIVTYEVNRTPDPQRKLRLKLLMSLAKDNIRLDPNIIQKAKGLERSGLKPIDALHVACAESAHLDLFLTTDKKLVSKANGSDDVIIKVINPIEWIDNGFS